MGEQDGREGKQQEQDELLRERYDLVTDRIRQIPDEHFGVPAFEKYFAATAEFLLYLDETREFLAQGGLERASLKELAERNHRLYADVLPQHYEVSFCNPEYAAGQLGEELGNLMSWLSYRLFSLIGNVYENAAEELTEGMELFTEVYTAFVYEWQEEKKLPSRETVRRILAGAVCDCLETETVRRIQKTYCPEDSFGVRLLEESDLSDVRYLYAYGEYVSENELATAKFLAGLEEKTIAAMADTYTEGYRIGFEITGKDIRKKRTVRLCYRIGFERMMLRAVENLKRMGLQAVAYRDRRTGFAGASPNRQMEYDHKEDMAVYLDKNYRNRGLDALRNALETYKRQVQAYAGPAVVETFGEADFEPVNRPAALKLTPEQNRLKVEYDARRNGVFNEYADPSETSYTIIAFPVPEIGPVFQELFAETVRINTLDYRLYRDVQQKLVDALDQADFCEIRGMGKNRTDLKVNLWKRQHPERETIFENCVADVNIPVGEVFTSPVLEGTEGLLHVTRVFLDGLEYRDLFIAFRDGMITDYGCANFADPAEGRRFVWENVLKRRDTLAMGEFAIGTNTAAYVMAKRLGVEAKLPILIAEKMGPHFAVGDTCYSHAEDVKVYNPDGREIIARENAVSAQRREHPLEAYYNCHTDITIPYDELGELTGVRKDGGRIPVIREGRFVLPGTEPLNEPFAQPEASWEK